MLLRAAGALRVVPGRRGFFNLFKPRRTIADAKESIDAEYELGDELGVGRYGVVRRGIRKGTTEAVAIKSIPKSELFSAEAVQDEIETLRTVRHTNVMELLDVFEDRKNVHIVTPLYEGGELFDAITLRGRYTFSESDAASIVRQILLALECCWDSDIAHRDIKPENILFKKKAAAEGSSGGNNSSDGSSSSSNSDSGSSSDSSSGGNSSRRSSGGVAVPDEVADGTFDDLVLVDFGMARKHVPESRPMVAQVGSPSYVAPEVLKGTGYTRTCDVWSVGVIMYILLCGEPPFHAKTTSETMRKVREGKYECNQLEWQFTSPGAQDLVELMMDTNADTRITPSEALLHPWLSGMSDDLRNPLPSAVVSRLGEYQDFGTMKQKVLGMIVKNMEDDELEGFAKMFRRLDADGNGEVTVAEVNAALNQLGLPESEDVDETQTVTYAEFVAACMGRNAFLQEERLFAIFEQIDEDGSGTLDANEMKQVFGPNVDIEDVLKEADQNGDGEINYEEFCALMRRKGKLSRVTVSAKLSTMSPPK